MRWKWIIAIGALLIIALMVAVYVFLDHYDYNKLKPRISRMVKDATGRDLRLDGEINLAIGLSPSLVVTDVTFANASWGSQPQMIKVEKLQAQVRLLPLLFKDVQLKRIGLAGVDVLLETDPNGQGNWDFIAGDSSARKAGAFKPKDIEIDNIRIEKLQLIFREGKTGSTKRFTLASLDLARKEAEDKLTLDLKADYKGQPVTLSGQTGLISDLLTNKRFPLELSGTVSKAKFAITGAIDEILDLQGINLKVRASGTDLAKLGFDKNIPLPKTDVFDVTGHLRGSKESLALNEASGNLSASGINLAFSGNVGDLIALSGIDLKLNGSGKDLSAAGSIIGEKLPATDKFAVQGQLTGSTKILSLKEVQGNAQRGSLNLTMNGRIKDLLNFNGVDLVVKCSGKDLSEVGAIIEKKLPATDEFAVEGSLTGSAKALSLKEAQGSAKRGSLSVALNGEVKDLLAFSGVDLNLKGSGKDLAEIGPIIDQKLPATDQFAVQARLTGSSKALSLQGAQGSASRGSLSVALNGGIKDLIGISGMDLKLKGSGKDLAEVGAIIDQKLPATDEFAIEARLTGSAKSLSLQQAQGSANRGSLNLTLSGGIAELPALDGINFKVKVSGKELAEIGILVGAELPELGPFDMSTKLSGSAKAISLNEFSAMLDKSDFNGLAKVEVLKRPKITVHLESSVIDFTTLMKSLEKDEKKPANKNKQQRRLFSDDPLPFDALKKVDADIVLKARNIQAKDARLEFGHMTLKLEDSDFSIDRLEATYRKTKISGNLHIDPGSPPQVATNFLVQNFNLGDFLKETGKSDQVRAIVDIAAHGKSRGNSVNSLMANLNGAFGAVMGPGYLTKYLDLLSVDLSQKVIPIWGSHKKAGEINCAVFQFDIKKGVAASQAFVFDTQIGVLSAEGDINLGTEQINFLLVPEPKNPGLLSLSTKLRVSGTLMDPKVRPDTLSLITKGAKFLSTLAVGPIGLLAPFVHLGAHKKHPCDIQGIGQLGLNIPAEE
ncbi:MAG: AsmA family protein [Desulfobacterales bacterium]|nr:AsmA family protein [Desulfobacterales bacterium]